MLPRPPSSTLFPYTTLFRSSSETRSFQTVCPCGREPRGLLDRGDLTDRKSTRLNSSHLGISYAVFCLKKKKNLPNAFTQRRQLLLRRRRPSDLQSDRTRTAP